VDAGLKRLSAVVAAGATLGAAAAAEAGTAAGSAAASGAGVGAGVAGAAAVKAGGLGFAAKLAGALVIAGAVGTGAVFGFGGRGAAPSTPVAQQAAEAPAPPLVSEPSGAAPAQAASPELEKASDSEPQPAASASSKIGPRASTAPTLKDETEHLAKLREIARTDPARAATMASEGHARFAKGVFWQEREMILINALAASGRRDEAKARASALVAKNPDSPFAERLRRDFAIDR
jgi:hypothetical protein